MEISFRIQSIVAEIDHKIIADIGTDHGYIPILALQTHKATKAIACDVNPKPLEKAKQNIQSQQLASSIETRLGSGLSPLLPHEVETAIIAGMGGMLIIDILKESPNQTNSLQQLIVSPQSDIPAVRCYIHQISFSIADEKLVYEDQKFYHIFNCLNKPEPLYTETEYILGKCLLEKNEPIFHRYLENQIKDLEKVEQRLKSSDISSPTSFERLKEVSAQLHFYKGVYQNATM